MNIPDTTGHQTIIHLLGSPKCFCTIWGNQNGWNRQ